MKSSIHGIILRSGVLLFFIILSSFATRPGSDSFEVYLNDKLVLKEYVLARKANSIMLDDAANDRVNVFYSHCGITGSSRKITLKNEDEKVLKEWRFTDVDSHTRDAMSIYAKDITAFKKENKSVSLLLLGK